jgi:CBS domain-containing protein
MIRHTQVLTVGERMAGAPITISADAPLSDAVRVLDEHRISGLPVVNAAGTLVGVLSQTDLARARSTEYLWANWPGLAVRHLMTAPAVVVHRSTPLAQAARKMERHRIHRLVVVADDDETRPVGVLSMTDLVHAIADETSAAQPTVTAVPGTETPDA